MICEQGDIIDLNFDPSHSHEPAGRHFGIVISPWNVNSMSALTIVAPVTSVDNGYPLHVRITEGNEIFGFVQCEAIRAIDLNIREAEGKAKTIGSLDDTTMQEVMACVLVVIGQE
jgi:mRNA interferase MazF